MKQKVLCLGIILILAGPASAAWLEFYNEDFSNEPYFEICGEYTPVEGEYFRWNEVDEYYEVRIQDTQEFTPKYACSPTFDVATQDSFRVRLDIKVVEHQTGLPIGVRCVTAEVPEGNGMTMVYEGAHNQQFDVADWHGIEYGTPTTIQLGVWYHFDMFYRMGTATVDISITDRESGVSYLEIAAEPFNPDAFDTIAIGYNTLILETSGFAQIHVDNIIVDSCVGITPNKSSTWGVVKSLYK
ncbi:MAG: hypothetical protein KJ970_12325 [Candidatus Eisenbacteria bacterium]|uniref:LamG domain-containing protein n=1 Tax=Eiseniibacteriota bacterium TaxID=2212470 RepID=A0A948WDB4_UNCEI|nr:hypothetical protein [Candidatus Eisenbacteria bacterium]MBU1949799.1 hypothetical protein [Candidatus Eisenbacteria bacterium]MBU2691703.1 hypothetical protein [Candidatus Eisenbacteria bacterium]